MTRETLAADIVDRLTALASDSKDNAQQVISNLIRNYEESNKPQTVHSLTKEYHALDAWHESVKKWPEGMVKNQEIERVCNLKANIAWRVSRP